MISIGGGGPRVELPVWIAAGLEPGGTLFLSAGMHGDEVNAVTMLRRFVDQLDLTQLVGRLVIVPVANVSGFRARTRTVPEDGRDLNRTFPGDPKGTPSERIAHFILTELVAAADWGVDLHDAGTGSVFLPHVRVLDDRAIPFAAAFGTEIVMKATLPPGYGGLLTVEARKAFDQPFFHVEAGGEPALWPHMIKRGVMGLQNLLIFRGMLPGKMLLPGVQYFLPGRDDLAVLAPMEGLLTVHVALGQTVVRGHALATIDCPFTRKRVVVRARVHGFVLALNVRALVQPGEDVVGVIGCDAGPARAREPRPRTAVQRVNRPGKRVMVERSSTSLCPHWLAAGSDEGWPPSGDGGRARV